LSIDRIGTNRIETLPEGMAEELHTNLLEYIRKVQNDHEQVKAWNDDADLEMFKSIHSFEITSYQDSEHARTISRIMIGLVLLGTVCTMIEKIWEKEE